MHRDHEHLPAERGDVVGPAAAREPDLRVIPGPEQARVDVPVGVDLGEAEEAVVEEATLGEEEGIGDPRQHHGVAAGGHLVGRDRKLACPDVRADRTAFHHDGQLGSVRRPGEDGGQQRCADAGEDDLAVFEQAAGGDGEKLLPAPG